MRCARGEVKAGCRRPAGMRLAVMAAAGYCGPGSSGAQYRMTRRRYALLAVTSMAISVVACLALAEIALRLLPVATGLRSVAVTTDQPIFHFTPDRPFVYSRDWDLAMVNRGRVNNAGFINDQEYRKDDDTPLLAIVGDSMIEAQMVAYPDTLQGRLAKALEGRLRVYSFAASGAPLSQDRKSTR